jgi:hypothetical protein
VNLGTPHVNFDRSHSNEPYSDVLGHIQISTNGELKAGPPKVERVTKSSKNKKGLKPNGSVEESAR